MEKFLYVHNDFQQVQYNMINHVNLIHNIVTDTTDLSVN